MNVVFQARIQKEVLGGRHRRRVALKTEGMFDAHRKIRYSTDLRMGKREAVGLKMAALFENIKP